MFRKKLFSRRKKNLAETAQTFNSYLFEFLRIFPIGVILLTCLVGFVVFHHYRDEQNLIKQVELTHLELAKKSINQHFLAVTSDLQLLANSPQLKLFLEHPDELNREMLNHCFLNLARSKKLYDQIRLLDDKGMETVRIKYNNGKTQSIEKTALQNKTKRYYFTDTMKIKKGEVYVSPLDLNIEQGSLELPIKPTIRFGTPVFNNEGDKKGIILLNYFGNLLLSDLRNILEYEPLFPTHKLLFQGTPLNSIPMLLNRDGYWLLGPDHQDEWGFMLNHKRSFATRYPEIWLTIAEKENGQIFNKGLFSHSTIYPLCEGQFSTNGSSEPFMPSQCTLSHKEYYWKVVSFLPPAFFRSLLIAYLTHGLYPFSLFLLPWTALSIYLAFINTQNKMALQKKDASEKALALSEEKFRTVATFSYDWEYWLDPNKRFVYVSSSCQRVTGYPPDDFFKNPDLLFSLVLPDDQPIFQQHVKKEFFSNTPCHHVFRINARNGDMHWIDHICQPVFDSEGNFFGRRGSNRDITELKIAEQMLLQDQARQKMLLQLYEKETGSQKDLLSFAVESMVRLSASQVGLFGSLKHSVFSIECMSENVDKMCALSDQPGVFEILNKGIWAEIIKTRQAVYENNYATASRKKGYPPGHLDIHRFLAVPVIEKDYIVAIGAVANKATHYDKNDSKQLQLFLQSIYTLISKKKAEEKVLQAKQEWERTFASVPDMICIIDTNYHILQANEAMQQELQITPESLSSGKCYHFMHGAEKPPADCPHAKLLQDGSAHECEIFEPHLNRYLHVTVNPFMDLSGKLLGSVHVARDITQQKQIETMLRQINALQEELLKPELLEKKLFFIAEQVNSIFHADFTRIWLTQSGDLCDKGCIHAESYNKQPICKGHTPCLHLLASSGRYTHTDGKTHRRIPIGAYKIGRIASGAENKFLTNDVIHDSSVHDHEWARKLNLQSFAGYRLYSEKEQPLGVIALFSKKYISPEIYNLLEGVANTTTQVIRLSEAEKSMQKYAETQQVLLREVNHRVKNNLTAMISMLHQEEDRTSTENSGKNFKSRIQDIVGRTESLLIVHSLLSSSHWKPLLLKQLCGEIISHTIQGMAQKEAVRFQIDCPEDVYVSSDQAHNLTLIFNELATNTVKYARGKNKTSMIQLFIERQEQTIHIVFHDNGPGYPDFVLAKKDFSRNIGFQLISGFVRKNLHGTLEVFNDGGAVTSISFPMNQSSNQDKDGIDYGE